MTDEFYSKDELKSLIKEVVEKSLQDSIKNTVKEVIEKNYEIKAPTKPQSAQQPFSGTYTTSSSPQQKLNQSVPKSNFWNNFMKISAVFVWIICASWAVTNYVNYSTNKLSKTIVSKEETLKIDDLSKNSLIQDKLKEEIKVSVKPVSEPEKLKTVDGFEKVDSTKFFYLRGTLKSGKVQIRTGGSDSWRLNNPGMIIYGKFTKDNGAVGKYNDFAVFPSYEHGRHVLKKLFWESDLGFYKNKLINAIKTFAPKENGYEPEKYAKDIAVAAGITIETELLDMTEDQREKMLDVIQKNEKWDVGRILEYKDEAEWKRKGY